MRVVGHLVKDLCLPSNWNAHVDWLSKTINCLAKLENVTLNFDHFPAIHSTEAIFWTLEKLPNLRGIRVVQNNAFHNVYEYSTKPTGRISFQDPFMVGDPFEPTPSKRECSNWICLFLDSTSRQRVEMD